MYESRLDQDVNCGNIDIVETTPKETYQDMFDAFAADRRNYGSEQDLKNIKSAFKKFFRSLDMDIQNDISPLVIRDFKDLTEESITRCGLKNRAVRDFRYKVRKVFNSWIQTVTIQSISLSNDFTKTLGYYYENSGLSITELSLNTGIKAPTLRRWLNGTHLPSSVTDVKKVEYIEEVLSIPKNDLISLTKCANFRKKKQRVKNHKEQYSVPFPNNFFKEWESFLKYKTSSNDLGLFRNKPWTLCDAEDASKETRIQPYAYVKDGRVSASAAFISQKIKCFLGVLKKEGINIEKASLVWLCDSNLIYKYLDYIDLRNGETKNTQTILLFSSSLLLKDLGYFRQQPKFGKKLRSPVPPREWESWCSQQYKKIKNTLDMRKEGWKKASRDPKEPIQKILDQQHPLSIIKNVFEKRILKAFEVQFNFSPKAITTAKLYRDYCLIQMIRCNPLRIKMFAIMKHRHLHKKDDGSWWICFKKREFKNHYSKAHISEDYNAPLPEAIWTTIDRYMTNFRTLFSGAEESDFIFLTSWKKNKFLPMNLSAVVRRLSQQYFTDWLIDGRAIGPHAIRHIIATDILKNNPNRVDLAATALHDTEDTVRNEYAHLLTSDRIKSLNNWHKEQEEYDNEKRIYPKI